MTPTTPEPSACDKSVSQRICQRCGRGLSQRWDAEAQDWREPRRCPKCGANAPNRQRPKKGEPPPTAAHKGSIGLPNSCPLNKQTFVRILTAVSPESWNGAGFDGSLHKPGAQVAVEVVRAHPVVLECAGPSSGDKRDWLWILWRFDAEAKEWRELARALAHDWYWAVILRGPAIRALEPRRESADPRDRTGTVLEELLRDIDAVLARELPGVRNLVLCALHDRVCARLVETEEGAK
jgi:hypothetical protein